MSIAQEVFVHNIENSYSKVEKRGQNQNTFLVVNSVIKGGGVENQRFYATNHDEEDPSYLEFTITGGNWLTLSPQALTVPADSASEIGVTYNVSGLDTGYYEAFIELSENWYWNDNNDSVLPVEMYVISNENDVFNQINMIDTAEILNNQTIMTGRDIIYTGDSTLYSSRVSFLNENSFWLSFYPSTMVVPNMGNRVFEVKYETQNLPAGTYLDTISLSNGWTWADGLGTKEIKVIVGGNNDIINVYNNISNIKDLNTNKLIASTDNGAAGLNNIAKICADNSESTILEIGIINDDVNINNYIVKNIPNIGQFRLRGLVEKPEGKFVQFYYKHPNNIQTAQEFQEVNVECYHINNSIQQIINNLIFRIYREPIVLVHGLWSSRATMFEMERALSAQKWNRDLIMNVNYRHSNDRSLTFNKNVFPINSRSLLRRLRNKNYSAGKVSVVTHSMGGLVLRNYLAGNSNYKYSREIKNIIHISAPLAGSQFADYMFSDNPGAIKMSFLLNRVGRSTMNGAVSDLRVQSGYLDYNINYKILPTIPTISLVTETNIDNMNAGNLRTSYKYAALFDGYNINNNENEGINDFLQDLFEDESDLIVPIGSQLTAFNVFFDHIHTGSVDDEGIIEYTIDSLNNSTGFYNGIININDLDFNYQAPNNMNRLFEIRGDYDPIIYLPLPNSEISPKDYLNIVVMKNYDIVDRLEVCLSFENMGDIVCKETHDSSIDESIEIPANASGKINIIADNYINDILVGSSNRIINITTQNLNIQYIKALPEEIIVPVGETVGFSVDAIDIFGNTYDITYNNDVVYELDYNHALITVAPGVIEGKNIGETSFYISIDNNRINVPVRVVDSNYFQTLSDFLDARITNISTRGFVGSEHEVMIGGFIIEGEVPETVLITGKGPSLAQFGVTGVLENPTLKLYSGQTEIASNDNWIVASNADIIAVTPNAPQNNLESAILITLNPGAYTVHLAGYENATGEALVEIWDTTSTNLNSKLTNISTRGRVNRGQGVIIGGFIIEGETPKTVLITGKGPSLAQFGVSNVLENPYLRLYSGSMPIRWIDNWTEASNADIIAVTPNAPQNNLESAILITLNPGTYTAHLSGYGNTTGQGLIEIWDITDNSRLNKNKTEGAGIFVR